MVKRYCTNTGGQQRGCYMEGHWRHPHAAYIALRWSLGDREQTFMSISFFFSCFTTVLRTPASVDLGHGATNDFMVITRPSTFTLYKDSWLSTCYC